MDSTEALFGSSLSRRMDRKSMKVGKLSVVARDGIEPPTPAFSGLQPSEAITLNSSNFRPLRGPKTPIFLGQ
jgi:hypothetical protein